MYDRRDFAMHEPTIMGKFEQRPAPVYHRTSALCSLHTVVTGAGRLAE